MQPPRPASDAEDPRPTAETIRDPEELDPEQVEEAEAEAKRARGPIAWMARNSVAANIFMFILVLGGLMGVFQTKQEVFPEVDLDMVQIEVPYPGASPAEVEQGILLAIEEAVQGEDGVKRVTSNAAEGRGTVTVEILLDANPDKVLADVKNAVDGIQTFPEDAEEPRVALATRTNVVISLVIAGDQELRVLHDIAESARRDLLAKDGITKVELTGVPPLEIAVEVPRENLERYGLSLDQVAAQVRASSLELPGGEIETAGGEILVRLADRRKAGFQFEDIVLRGTANGAQIRLGDIAYIRDQYQDTDQASFYNGHRAVRLTVYRVGDETPTQVAALTRDYADQLRSQLPAEIEVAAWSDESEILEDRIDLLMRNAMMGLVLVIIILALFLDLRLALWVSLGIPISFLGSFLILGSTDLSINMITLFAFIVTLGMVVDDAIVVGEHTYSKIQSGMTPMGASISAAREMAAPVTFAILTTVAAFGPLFLVPGTMGKFFRMIPTVVVAVLVLSLLESFFVLPSHLAHTRGKGKAERRGPLAYVQRGVAAGLQWFIDRIYAPVLRVFMRGRYIVVGGALAIFILTIGYVASGRIPFNFFPVLEGNTITVTARLPYGTNIDRTLEVQRALEQAAVEAIDEYGGPDDLVRGTFTRVGESAPRGGPGGGTIEVGSHIVAIELDLVNAEDRDVTAAEIVETWRELTPELAGVESLTFSASSGPSAGAAVAIQLSHPDEAILAQASADVTESLQGFSELKNVRNEYAAGKPQLDFHLLPAASYYGLTGNEVARQLRASFYGSEAIRDQRGRNEMRVMVRLPEDERRSEYDLSRIQIRTPDGGHVPLGYVATFERGRAATTIIREDGLRNVNVTAELAEGIESPREVLATLDEEVYPELKERYPGLEIDLVGQQREQGETFASLGTNYLFALFVIYALLAIPFRSWLQPFIIMSVIPFGFVGAVLGHAYMGYGLSIMSMFGLVALSGVVVNDSLVLIDATNRNRKAGLDGWDAITAGARQRFRPILLTSLTTFFGLVPMIAETSIQARFLIPMAISLGFGVLFATVIVLLLVPSIYMVVEDLIGLFSRAGAHDEEDAGPPATEPRQADERSRHSTPSLPEPQAAVARTPAETMG